jgi:hypothetical protein
VPVCPVGPLPVRPCPAERVDPPGYLLLPRVLREEVEVIDTGATGELRDRA